MEEHRGSRAVAILTRVPLMMVTVIFTLIAFRYLTDPVRAASAAGIIFISPGGVTVARVGFAAFPLAFGAIALSCLLSPRRVLDGLYMVLILIGIVIVVRLLGMALEHSTETAKLLMPEGILAALSIVGVRLERARRRRERPDVS